MANTDQRGDEYVILMDPANPARLLKVNADGSINTTGQAPVGGSVAGVLTAFGQAVVAPIAGYATWTIVIVGTWNGTIAFQGSVDGGSTYPLNLNAHVMGMQANSTVQSTTVNGQWDGSSAPLTHVRAYATVWASGSANVSFVLSQSPLFVTMLSALPPGTNTIGAVKIAKGTAGELAVVTVTTSPAPVLAANAARIEAILTNTGTATVSLGGVGIAAGRGVQLAPGQTFVDDRSTGTWYGIVASGTSTVAPVEVV